MKPKDVACVVSFHGKQISQTRGPVMPLRLRSPNGLSRVVKSIVDCGCRNSTPYGSSWLNSEACGNNLWPEVQTCHYCEMCASSMRSEKSIELQKFMEPDPF